MKKEVTSVIPQDARNDEVEIDLLDLLFYYWTKKWILLVAFLIGAVIAGGVTKGIITPKYTATSKMYMVSAASDKVVDLTDLNIGTTLSEDYAELMKIRPIFEEVIKENKLDYTYETLLSMVAIAPIGETRILTISVTSPDPKEAQTIANAIADKAVTYLPKLMDTSAPNIAERAILPEFPSSPSLAKNTVLGALGAMILVLAIFTVLYLMDDTLNSEEDVEKYFGVIPMTVIPEGDIAMPFEDISKAKSVAKKQHRSAGRTRRKGA